jgi:hypothetical protein
VQFGLAVFLGAFLLFQVQPIVARYVLPWFGGSPAVWSTCILFFQAVLLIGYVYAHLLGSLNKRVQVTVHLLLLLLTLFTLPTIPSENWREGGASELPPTARLLLLLAVTVGLPCLLLSSTGPLIQRWFSLVAPTRSPYWLYSISNLGSLIALGSYPFVVEPALLLRTQMEIWSVGFVLFTSMCGMCALRLWRSSEVEPENIGFGVRWIRTGDSFLVFCLAACGTIMLMSATNQMCQDVASIPLLWIVPLSIYLLTFIVCFSGRDIYSRASHGMVWILAVIQACLVLEWGVVAPILVQIVSYCFTLGAACMVCHGEISMLKPAPRSPPEESLEDCSSPSPPRFCSKGSGSSTSD